MCKENDDPKTEMTSFGIEVLKNEKITKKYKDDFKVCPCIILVDFLLLLVTLCGIVFFDEKCSGFSKWNSSVIIFAVAIIVYTYLSVMFTKKYIFSYELEKYSGLKKEIKNKILADLNIGSEFSSMDEKQKERATKYIDEFFKTYDNYKSFLSDVLSAVISSFIISLVVSLVIRWTEINNGDKLNYLGGFTLAIFFSVLILHLIFIFSDIKYKYFYWKALREIKLELI